MMCSFFTFLLLVFLSQCEAPPPGQRMLNQSSLVTRSISWLPVCEVQESYRTARQAEIHVTDMETKPVEVTMPEWRTRSCRRGREDCRTLAYHPADPNVLVDYLQYGGSGLLAVPVSCSLVDEARQLCETESTRVQRFVPEVAARWGGKATLWGRMRTHICTSHALVGQHMRPGWEGGRKYSCRQDYIHIPIPLVVNGSRVEMHSKWIPVGCTALVSS